jgi:hypothetical protein
MLKPGTKRKGVKTKKLIARKAGKGKGTAVSKAKQKGPKKSFTKTVINLPEKSFTKTLVNKPIGKLPAKKMSELKELKTGGVTGGPEKKGHKRTSKGYTKKPNKGEQEPVIWNNPPPSMVKGYPKEKKNPNSMMRDGGPIKGKKNNAKGKTITFKSTRKENKRMNLPPKFKNGGTLGFDPNNMKTTNFKNY